MPNPLDDLTGKNIIVDGVALPDRKVVEFVAGEGVEFEATDDSVNGRTVITVTSTGGEGGGTVAATNVTWDDSTAETGSSDVQGALDSAWIYLNPVLEGKVVSQTGTPAYASGYAIQRQRQSDSAFITRLAANIYRAEKHTVTAVASGSATTVCSLTLENNTSASVAVVLRGIQDSDATIRAEIKSIWIHATVNGSGVVTVNTALSNNAQPDGLPLTSIPAWIGSDYTAIAATTSTGTNTLNIQVDQATSTAVTWYTHVDALVTGA